MDYSTACLYYDMILAISRVSKFSKLYRENKEKKKLSTLIVSVIRFEKRGKKYGPFLPELS